MISNNDIDIEGKALKSFKKLRVEGRTDKIKTSADDIDSFIIQQGKFNLDFFYAKKCLHDFMPLNNGNEFKRSLRIKINEFANFKEVYEEHLTRLNLKHKYNPQFIDIRQNKN